MIDGLKNIFDFLKNNINLTNKLILNTKKPNTLKKNKLILDNLMSISNNLFDSTSELIYVIRNKQRLEHLHIFCNCGKKNNFINYNKGYTKHCSPSCYFSNMEDSIKLNKQTKKSRYGDENYVNIEKHKRTCYERYGESNYSKTKIGRLNASINLHTANANKNRKISFLKRFGVDHPWKNKEFVKLNQLIILNKYGKKSFSKTEKFKKLWENKEFVNNRQLKQYNTKRKNRTFNTSKPEESLFSKLKQKFPDAVHHYIDNSRYPFECDFYIPSEDLFIELNFHWTHGSEPFDKNNINHQKLINSWNEKSKCSKFYRIAIKVWTNKDPLKLQTFINNKLNYKIFYNKKEFNDWFKAL